MKYLDRCQSMDVTLSQQSTYLLFAQGNTHFYRLCCIANQIFYSIFYFILYSILCSILYSILYSILNNCDDLLLACRVALSASTPLSFPPNFLAPSGPVSLSMSQSSLASSSSAQFKHSRGGSGSGSPFPSSPSHTKNRGSKRKSMFGGVSNYGYLVFTSLCKLVMSQG